MSTSSSNNDGWLGKILGAFLGLMIFSAILSVFANTQTAVNAAQAEGLTNITVLSTNWVIPEIDGCIPSDPKEVTLTATNLRGQRVMVHVCIGFWHNARVNPQYVLAGSSN